METVSSYGYEMVDHLPDNLNELFHFNCEKTEVYNFLYRLKYPKEFGLVYTDRELLEIILTERFPKGIDFTDEESMGDYLLCLYKQFGRRFVNKNFRDIELFFKRDNQIIIIDNIARVVSRII